MLMPFGKHKGKAVQELPNDYLLWLADIELREPLKTAVEREVDKRFPLTKRPADEVQEVAQQIVSAGYKTLAKVRHPDHNGTHQEMLALNAAHEWLLSKIAAW